jgi:hypothetical protein
MSQMLQVQMLNNLRCLGVHVCLVWWLAGLCRLLDFGQLDFLGVLTGAVVVVVSPCAAGGWCTHLHVYA